MPLFRYGAQTFECVQFMGDNALDVGYLCKAEETSEDMLGDFMEVTCHGRKLEIKKGQWVIEDKGHIRVTDDATFRKYYKAAE